MHDKLLIANKIKKTIIYIETMTNNYPKIEYILKNKILDKTVISGKDNETILI